MNKPLGECPKGTHNSLDEALGCWRCQKTSQDAWHRRRADTLTDEQLDCVIGGASPAIFQEWKCKIMNKRWVWERVGKGEEG